MQKCTTVQEVINALPSVSDANIVYRGHSDRHKHKLVPHVFREESFRASEHLLLNEIEAAQPHEFLSDLSVLERLVRMQHYDLPTRILDVSWNPLVALYFACESNKGIITLPPNSSHKTMTVERDGELICFEVHQDIVRYFDSDTVSCMTNLARLKQEQKQNLKDIGMDKAAFCKSIEGKRLIHFINSEKPGFLPEIEPEHLYQALLVKPKQANRRIIAQAGGFFVFGLSDHIEENGNNDIKISRICIPGNAKSNIREQLDKLSINERSMFPELDRSSRYIKEFYKKKR